MEVKVNLVRWTGKWQTQEGNTGAKVQFPNCARIQEKNFALQQRLLLLKIKMKKKMFDASSNSGAHLAHPSRFGLATTPLLSMA